MKPSILKKILLIPLFSILLMHSYAGTTDTTVLKRTYQTTFASSVPVIDGLLNDEAWNLVEWTR